MVLRQEILDSEDDGSDLEPVEVPIPILHHLDAPDIQDKADAPCARGTDSTDQSFFQRVYDEQRVAAVGNVGEALSVNTGESRATTSANSNFEQQQTTKSSSSITDPVLASRIAKARKAVSRNDVTDLTQVTTPSRDSSSWNAAGERDIWDIPDSPEPRSDRTRMTVKSGGKVMKTYGKRGSGSQLQSSPRPKVIRMTGESGGSVLPDTCVPDASTSASLYITPALFSSSQKQKYRNISISEHDLEHEDLSLAHGSEHLEPEQESSAATIAYTTPSRYASSGLKTVEEEPAAGLGCQRTPRSAPDVLPSSPDIITATVTSAKRKRGRPAKQAVVSLEADSHVSTKSSKKRRSSPIVISDELEQQDESWGSEVKEFPQGQHQPRPNHRRTSPDAHVPTNIPEIYEGDVPVNDESGLNVVVLPDTEGILAEHQPSEVPAETSGEGTMGQVQSQAPNAADPKPKKKRGRKKKQSEGGVDPVSEQSVFETAVAVDEHVPPIIQELQQASRPDERLHVPVKRKRGRPKKSDSKKLPAQNVGASDTAPSLVPDPETNAGGPPKVDGTEAESVSQVSLAADQKGGREEEYPNEKILGEISQNPQTCRGNSGMAECGENAPPEDGLGGKPAADKVIKPDKGKPTGMQQATGKAQYRIGLSKRSRIAPLLKSLRK